LSRPFDRLFLAVGCASSIYRGTQPAFLYVPHALPYVLRLFVPNPKQAGRTRHTTRETISTTITVAHDLSPQILCRIPPSCVGRLGIWLDRGFSAERTASKNFLTPILQRAYFLKREVKFVQPRFSKSFFLLRGTVPHKALPVL